MSITLYSNGCPKCQVLEEKLREKGIHHSKIQDEKFYKKQGISKLPQLDVDGKFLGYFQAINWMKNI